ncbi:MAG: gamma carbonic anhydrase family protein [Hyphomicrobiaceae bacterium]|nr:gamma carbonic anhydrase family protein [Hyphomicrobiaceae bacterium]
MGLFVLDAVGVKTPGDGRYWVAPNAAVIGNVRIGENASIWFNTVVRGDNDPIEIGDGSNVQDGCVLHADPGFPTIIGADCTVGHMVMLHGCRIGRGSLVGIGSIILNGAVIGEECLIGAHSLVPEGKEIPPRSVVMGSPCKIVRQVTEADLALMQVAAANYRRHWRRYAAGMTVQP